MTRLAIAIALLVGACAEPPDLREARETYNQALLDLEDGELESAAEKLLTARDEAGQDPELRFRAAYNLGITHARIAAGHEQEEPEKAAEELRRAAGWFRDAARLRPDDEAARVNLEVVLRRLQLLADRLNRGENGLEARLSRLIEDQRGVRDQIRQLMSQIGAAGADAEPVAFREEFEAIATTERTLMAEAGTVSDMAGEELSLLEGKPERERSEQDRMRIAQLQNLDRYLQSARSGLADTRRALRRLRGDRAHRRADAALGDLKRAREQLLDPVKNLQRIARDEQGLARHTEVLVEAAGGGVDITGEGEEPPEPPAWLTDEHLVERQSRIESRLADLLMRLRAGVDASGQNQGAAQPQDPQQQHMLEAARDALPHLAAADQAMIGAGDALDASRHADALEREREALEALARAIERFAGVRQLIELAWRDQTVIVELLTPPDERGEDAPPLPEMTTEERMRRIDEALAANVDRLDRLEGALAAEKAAAEKKAQGAAQEQGLDPQSEEAQQALAATEQKFARAEELRVQAADALNRAAEILESGRRWAPGEGPLPPATETLEHIEELRRLFFTIVEHLKQLLRDQGDSHDRTASARDLVGAERLELIGPAADEQKQHAKLGDALASALEKQADQAGQAGGQNAAQAADAARRLADAAVEVRSAATEMHDAAGSLDEAVEMAEKASYDLEPTLGMQKQAMTHLEEAIRLLQPPQQQNQQQNQQQQKQQQQQQPEEQMSEEEARRRLQAIRDREAERDRERRRRQRSQPEPVEKNW